MPSSRPQFLPGAGPARATWRLTDDAAAAHALHSAVLAVAPGGIVRPDPLAHFTAHTGQLGVTLGCFLDSGAMVAYGVLGLHSPVVGHLADLLAVDQRQLCVLDGAAALPEWRGYGVHQAAIEQRIAFGAAAARPLVAATVSPHNLRALRSVLRAGLRIERFGMLYGGLPRLIVLRHPRAAPPRLEQARLVEAGDHDGHQAALADGLVGYGCLQRDDGAWLVQYGAASPTC